MHELSLCGAIAEIVRRHAPDQRVQTIHLQVGQLRQVVPDTLAYCWMVAVADTALAGSVLNIEHVPARICCADCEHTSEIGEIPIFVCHGCDGYNVRVIAGEELLVTALDLAEVFGDGSLPPA